jgi:hypothetical protein
VGNNPLVITDPTGLRWYYSLAEDRYKWSGDNDTVEDGYTPVVGTQGRDDRGAGSFIYQTENGWVRLNPYTNSFSIFDTREAATGDFESVYQCNCQGLANTIADESVRKGTTVAIAAGVAVAVGTGAGVAMAATGTAVGGTVTTLGLTGTGTAATAATTTAGTAGTAASAAEVEAVITRGLANPSTRGLTKQLIKHQQKLLEYIKNPANADNKGFLRNASPERFDKVVSGRVKQLTHQIKNYYQQIKSKL